jgi:hypothetical protein
MNLSSTRALPTAMTLVLVGCSASSSPAPVPDPSVSATVSSNSIASASASVSADAPSYLTAIEASKIPNLDCYEVIDSRQKTYCGTARLMLDQRDPGSAGMFFGGYQILTADQRRTVPIELLDFALAIVIKDRAELKVEDLSDHSREQECEILNDYKRYPHSEYVDRELRRQVDRYCVK